MARIRTIKPSFFASLSNADLPVATRLTWVGLWTYVDDKGRGVDDARLVKAAIWPLDEGYTTKKVEADLVILEKAGKIGRYIHDGQRYLGVVKWRTHQRIDKPQPSTLPAAPWEDDSTNDPGKPPQDSGSIPGTVPESSGTVPRTVPPKAGGEVEGKGSGRESSSSATRQERSRRSPEDDDEGSPIDQTLAIIADRRIAAAEAGGVEIKNPGGYRRKVLQAVDRELGDDVEKRLMDGQSPLEVADELVPPKSAAAQLYPAFESTEPVWDEVTDEHGHLVVVPRRSA